MRLPSPRYAVCLALVALAVMALCTPVWPLRANPGASVSMSANASPGSVPAGGLVSYEVALTNTGDQSANDLAIAATLPSGFSYVPDSAQLSFNNIDSYWPDQAPAISRQSLTWSNGDIPDVAVPARRLGNYYGIHTFVQDYFDYSHVVSQLDKAHDLTGNGGYVTELLYPVTAQTTGANNDWKVFVQQACAKQLTPVVRLATRFLGSYWEKPTLDGALARAFGAVVADLRTVLPGNCTMYVQVLNEPNLTIEWGNDWPDPIAYGHFLVQVSVEIRKLYDSHIKILNGVLSPGGNYNNVSYTREMLGVDGALGAWDAWASHPYPANHPATYNIHDGTATYPDLVIDSYILEMRQISKRGRHVYDVLATETGYRLTDSTYQFEGFGPIRDSTRADFIQDAFQNRWTNWPELRASTPYELSDPSRSWWQFDWLKPDGYQPYEQFTRVRDIALKPGFEPNGRLTLTFQARAGYTAGTQTLAVTASASNASIAPVSADVTVLPGGPSLPAHARRSRARHSPHPRPPRRVRQQQRRRPLPPQRQQRPEPRLLWCAYPRT